MVLTKAESEKDQSNNSFELTSAKKRRIRRKKALARITAENNYSTIKEDIKCQSPEKIHDKTKLNVQKKLESENCDKGSLENYNFLSDNKTAVDSKSVSNSLSLEHSTMSSKEPTKSREEILAEREAKKHLKQKQKSKGTELKGNIVEVKPNITIPKKESQSKTQSNMAKSLSSKQTGITEKSKAKPVVKKDKSEILENPDIETILKQRSNKILEIPHVETEVKQEQSETLQSSDIETVLKREINKILEQSKAETEDDIIVKEKDEVDKAVSQDTDLRASSVGADKTKDEIKAARVAKKLAKKKGAQKESSDKDSLKEISNKTVAETLDKIVDIVKEVQEVSAKLEAFKADDTIKKGDVAKSKAELKAERRAKQEAQRAAKAAQSNVKAKSVEVVSGDATTVAPKVKKEKEVAKVMPATDKVLSKRKTEVGQRVNWFQHLYTDHEAASLKRIGINNSNLHPAIVKLGVQLASHVVFGSNARCIALLNALKQIVKDYTLPAKTEFSRGLESYLASSLTFLWSMRKPSASQTNAVKYFRYQLTQLPNNVNEFDAKTTLQEAIDTYIREQIDMAGQAISLSVRKKISNGDNILTYGFSSLIEKILKDAWDAGVVYRAVVVGSRTGAGSGARELLHRLTAHGVPCAYVDITALSFIMKTVNKVIVGASCLLVNGWVMGAAGTALVALEARAHNVPVLVCCERHKVSERVQTDAFVYNEIGDPDDLIDKSDESSPLKDWRSNPNLTVLNLMYDVTPPSLVTAVVTDLAILPCSSAPVVLRFMLSEYGF